jgi:hypothetical protein
MIQGSFMEKENLFCKQYKINNRVILEYRGIRLAGLKQILEYSFSGHVLKIERNHSQLQFDIYLSNFHKENKSPINMSEVEKFRNYYGKGFNLIIWSQVD